MESRVTRNQYVILGAGLDTFGYRRPDVLSALHVFEVDHPRTQAWKRERLRAAGINEPVGMRFVSVDFECESLQEGLVRMGFRVDAPAFVSWLGVTQYLTPAAIQSTLDLLGSFAPGSEVVVTYVVPDDLRDDTDHAFAAVAAALTAARGEPWLTFFHPAEFEALVRTSGFTSVEHFGPDEAASVHRGSNDASPPAAERWRREDHTQAVAALLEEPYA